MNSILLTSLLPIIVLTLFFEFLTLLKNQKLRVIPEELELLHLFEFDLKYHGVNIFFQQYYVVLPSCVIG